MLNQSKLMKAAFQECMQSMYPGEMTNQYQHRDLVRVFMFAWIQSPLASGDISVALELAQEYEEARSPDWWPDESWNW